MYTRTRRLLCPFIVAVKNRITRSQPSFSSSSSSSSSYKRGDYISLDSIATLDLSRESRCGFPEVVFGSGKLSSDLVKILDTLYQTTGSSIATRISKDQYDYVKQHSTLKVNWIYNEHSRILYSRDDVLWDQKSVIKGKISILTAGTSDVLIAEEAGRILELCKVETVQRVYDVGVAGIQRLFHKLPLFRDSDVVIVCAGMDGALPSVVGGLVSAPVIAVPTSIGYGASFHGISAMLTMLNSCSPGVTVVNIDNGFGAAVTAYKIINLKSK